jgi:hypothetical protein
MSTKQSKPQPKTNQPDLADLLVAVIKHPDCPQEIIDGINESTSELFNRLNQKNYVYLTAPYIRSLIIEHKAQEKGGAR